MFLCMFKEYLKWLNRLYDITWLGLYNNLFGLCISYREAVYVLVTIWNFLGYHRITEGGEKCHEKPLGFG